MVCCEAQSLILFCFVLHEVNEDNCNSLSVSLRQDIQSALYSRYMEVSVCTFSMPEVNTKSCDFPAAAASPALCGMDIGHCSDDLQVHFPILEPDHTFPRAVAMTYTASVHESRAIPCCQDGISLNDMGLMGSSGSTAQPAYCHLTTEHPCHVRPGGFPALTCAESCVAVSPGARLYRSLENLHWATVTEGKRRPLSPPCRGVESEFVFHCQTTSNWYEISTEHPGIDSLINACGHLPLSPHSRTPRGRHLPPFAKVPQCLFPTMNEKVLNGDAKKGLKEKLRLQSNKTTELNKPVRPHALLRELAWKDCAGRENCGHCKSGCSTRHGEMVRDPSAATPNGCTAPQQRSQRLTSPAEIKEEAMRRLKLRRQNSTPNLTLPCKQEGGEVVKSQTTEPVGECEKNRYVSEGSSTVAERRRNFKARVHIPSFEEFKRMRKREKCQSPSTEAELQGSREKSFVTLSSTARRTVGGSCPSLTKMEHHTPRRRQSAECDHGHCCSYSEPQQLCQPLDLTPNRNGSPSKTSLALQTLATLTREDHYTSPDPICTSPAPGLPLQNVALPHRSEELVSRQEVANWRGFDQGFSCAEKNVAGEAQLSCCPSLLLEAAADLSVYGVKFQQMKDGLIGSAIDLIKKSCTAESAAVQSSHQQELDDITINEQDNQSGLVSMATLDCGAECNRKPAGVVRQTDCHSLPGCRRSSSDAAYGTTETAKAQRECRLRPHFSDPMPADAVKRKQLEMRIAAAAWGLGQKRRQDKDCSDPLSNQCNRTADSSPSSKPRDNHLGPGSSHRSKHRWSNLSTDSGVVGLNDRSEEREEEDEEWARKSKPAEVERADSGIGPAMAKKWKSRVGERARSVQAWVAHRPCVDCGERDILEADPRATVKRRENLCGKCAKRRTERKEAILEFVNTESSYGEDLRIIKEEFQLPMQAAGLLTPEQLAVIFSNIQELIEVNERFLERLHDSTEQAFDQDDEDFLTVCIGEMFLEFVNMLPAFQTYCIHQSTSINMLNTLEKEKELLRIFLDVSQNDNTALRRMNLRSFLMAPLQRVTKYPLLLSRISNSTPEYHPDHCGLREAKSRVESHLEHINMKTKQEGAPPWSLRSFRRDSRRNREVVNIEMREIAIKAVGWPREDTRFAMEGTLQSSQPSDGQWAKKGSRSLKFQNLHVLLMVNAGRELEPSQEGTAGEHGWEPLPVRDAALVLIRDKSGGKFALFRRPIHLSNCVVSSDPDCDDTFELLDIRKEAFVFRDADKHRTRHWFRLIKRFSRDLGSWRKRRNALPNIMINATYSRA
ncbi:uncharacterized protein arhgef49 [Heterodontus francisci]|uniref:uncharacterized protein arhgef49 n=1 Tax=Heterodontus francisci TaxID=7792 RepID=UPI00355B869F